MQKERRRGEQRRGEQRRGEGRIELIKEIRRSDE